MQYACKFKTNYHIRHSFTMVAVRKDMFWERIVFSRWWKSLTYINAMQSLQNNISIDWLIHSVHVFGMLVVVVFIRKERKKSHTASLVTTYKVWLNSCHDLKFPKIIFKRTLLSFCIDRRNSRSCSRKSLTSKTKWKRLRLFVRIKPIHGMQSKQCTKLDIICKSRHILYRKVLCLFLLLRHT